MNTSGTPDAIGRKREAEFLPGAMEADFDEGFACHCLAGYDFDGEPLEGEEGEGGAVDGRQGLQGAVDLTAQVGAVQWRQGVGDIGLQQAFCDRVTERERGAEPTEGIDAQMAKDGPEKCRKRVGGDLFFPPPYAQKALVDQILCGGSVATV